MHVRNYKELLAVARTPRVKTVTYSSFADSSLAQLVEIDKELLNADSIGR